MGRAGIVAPGTQGPQREDCLAPGGKVYKGAGDPTPVIGFHSQPLPFRLLFIEEWPGFLDP